MGLSLTLHIPHNSQSAGSKSPLNPPFKFQPNGWRSTKWSIEYIWENIGWLRSDVMNNRTMWGHRVAWSPSRWWPCYQQHSPEQWNDNNHRKVIYRTVSIRLSVLCVKSEVCKCRGRAPSASARFCILAAISVSPSSMIAFITRPAPFTMAIDGCWNKRRNIAVEFQNLNITKMLSSFVRRQYSMVSEMQSKDEGKNTRKAANVKDEWMEKF